jgi:ABC-2 type transport system ATP-binding protein
MRSDAHAALAIGRSDDGTDGVARTNLPHMAASSGVAQGDPAVVVRGLRKSYDGVEAVAGLDLRIGRGEVFALLGPNGAGKTTTVEILEGYRRRNEGDVRVLGLDPEDAGRALRERIGIVLQESEIGLELTVREAVELWSAAYPRPLEPDDAIELVGLEDSRARLVRALSGGQRRRLDLALAVAGDPELLFLDEPTTGFDASARRRSWSLIENLRTLGKTILLTTHYMDEAQHLADRVAVMARGRIVAEGSPDALLGRANGSALIRFRLPSGTDRSEVPLPEGAELDAAEAVVTLRTDAPTRALTPLVIWAGERGRELDGLTVTRPSLEDVYLELIEERQS